MSSVLVAVPVWKRPQRAGPLSASLRASQGRIPLTLVFLVSGDDQGEIRAVKATGERYEIMPFARGPGDYARKINHALTLGDDDWIFTGADDLDFHFGWADHAINLGERTGKRVLGTNDLGNPAVKRGTHSTHSLVHRSYANDLGTIDQPGLIYHEGYHHNWCDVELIDTARSRNEFQFVARSHVEHLHPHWGKAPDDRTYQAGLEHFRDDRLLYQRRRQLWVRGRSYRRRTLL